MGFCWDNVSECFPTGKSGIAEDLVLVKFPLVHKPSSPCPPWSSLSRETTFPGIEIFIPTDKCSQLTIHAFCFVLKLVRLLSSLQLPEF